MELFNVPNFKNGLEILKKYYTLNNIKNSIVQINEKEYKIGYSDMWENVFTFDEINILESNNFYFKNNSIIYINR